jgi:hypothetical protein
MLTSITTVAGLLPLILETSFQAQFLIPMAVSIAFGILFGTFFILMFFPSVILVANGYRRVWYQVLNNEPNPIVGVLKLTLTHLFYVLFILLFPLTIILPRQFVDRIIHLLWGSTKVNPVEVEPAIQNLKEEKERDI